MKRKTAIEECLVAMLAVGLPNYAARLNRAHKELRSLLKAAKLLECWAFARVSEKTPQQTAQVLASLHHLGILPEEKPMCSQCGRPVCGRACGPTHAAMRAKWLDQRFRGI